MNISTSQQRAHKERLEELEREKEEIENSLRLQQFAEHYHLQFSFPWTIECNRTDPKLIHWRLRDAGVVYSTPTTLGDTAESVSRFIADLESSDCFKSVRVELGPSVPSHEQGDLARQLKVVLDEKQWYKVYIGGGLKRDAFQQPNTMLTSTTVTESGFLPTADLETTVGLRNIFGCLDTTEFHYSLDTRSQVTSSIQHKRPLYTMLPPALHDFVLNQGNGSKITFCSRLLWDTLDWDLTRGYRELQRLASVSVSTTNSTEPQPFIASLEWNFLLRDIIPRRHSSDPFSFVASKPVLLSSGPSLKHSVIARIQSAREIVGHPFFPVHGSQYQASCELAMPPGDAGFFKTDATVSLHSPILQISSSDSVDELPFTVSLHSIASFGVLWNMGYHGLCRPEASFSDKFLLGGPCNFRGFSSAGIGPRSIPVERGQPGDSLGGDFLLKYTCIISAPVPNFSSLNLRVFGFGTVGTCTNYTSVNNMSMLSVLCSSRASMGVGLATTALGPRLELTYGFPLRYSPRDNRRLFQVGVGFTLDG